jgi:hypothetical protein
MKTKLAPLALLIPAVVLAQSVAPSPSQGGMPLSQAGMPPPNTMPAPPVNPAKAAAALSTAKETSKKLNTKLSSNYGHGVCKSSGTLIYASSLSYICSVF